MERVDALDLNVYSAAFRTYDPALGRWWQQDPVQDGMPGLSSYHQTFGNPVAYADPLGLWPEPGLNRNIGESAGEQWMREHGMGEGYTNPVFAQGPSYQQQQMNQFFSSLPQGTYQVHSDDDELFRLTGFSADKYYARIFYRSFFGGGRNILESGIDPTYLQAGIGSYLNDLSKASNTAAYLIGTSLDVNQILQGQIASYAYLNDSRRALNRAYPGYFKGLSRTTVSALSNYKVAKAVASGLSKPLFGIGLVMTGVDIYQKDFSASSIAWGAADTGIALAALVASGPAAPFVAIGATLYFTGRFAYGVYDAYNEGK